MDPYFTTMCSLDEWSGNQFTPDGPVAFTMGAHGPRPRFGGEFKVCSEAADVYKSCSELLGACRSPFVRFSSSRSDACRDGACFFDNAVVVRSANENNAYFYADVANSLSVDDRSFFSATIERLRGSWVQSFARSQELKAGDRSDVKTNAAGVSHSTHFHRKPYSLWISDEACCLLKTTRDDTRCFVYRFKQPSDLFNE